MSCWVLKENVTVVSRKTVSKVTNIEDQNDEKKEGITPFDKATQERLNKKVHVIVEGGKDEPKDWSEHPFDCDPNFQEGF